MALLETRPLLCVSRMEKETNERALDMTGSGLMLKISTGMVERRMRLFGQILRKAGVEKAAKGIRAKTWYNNI